MGKLIPKDNADFEVSISNHSIFRVIVAVLVAVVLAHAIARSAGTLVLIGVAFFLSLALNGPVRWLASHLPGKRKGSRSLAATISVVVILGLLIAFLAAIVPPLVRQTVNFAQAVPELIQDANDSNTTIGGFIEKYNLSGQIDKISQQFSEKLDDAGSSALSTMSKVGSSLFATLTVIVMTVMMLLEGPHWVKMLFQMVPQKKRAHTKRLMGEMYKVVQGYVNGQVLLAAIASIPILITLLATGVSYPLALMVVVFICGLIPMVGHTLGAIIVTIIASFHSLTAAAIVLAVYFLYQQIENYVLQPKIQANSTNMSPLLVFLAVIIGVNFGGLLGGLVAIPVAGCIRILALDYLEQRNILSKAKVKEIKTEGEPEAAQSN